MPAVKIVRQDSWNNLLTGAGTIKDRSTYTKFTSRMLMLEDELNAQYIDNGFAKLVVDKYVEYMLRIPFEVDGDTDKLVQARIDEIKGWKELERLLRWDYVHGGGLCVMGINDGGKLEDELNVANIRDIEFLRTYDRWRVNWSISDLYTDTKNPKFGQVQWYSVTPLNGLAPYKVHETRCLVLDGVDVPEKVRMMNQGWGCSYIQHCFDQLRDLGEIYPAIRHIIEDFITQTISMQNLMEMLAAGKENVIRARLNLIDESRHVLNTILLDEREKFEKKASTVTGLSDIVDKFLQALCIVANIPARILLGSQAGGLNNKGEGETQDWYDHINSCQNNKLKPVHEKLTKIIMLCKRGEFRGVELPKWFINYPNLYQMDDKEIAEIYKINSEGDNNYVQAGVLDSAEVAISRFDGPTYGKQIVLMTKRSPASELGGAVEEDRLVEETKMAEAAAKVAMTQKKAVKKEG